MLQILFTWAVDQIWKKKKKKKRQNQAQVSIGKSYDIMKG